VPNNWNLYFSTDSAGNIYVPVMFKDQSINHFVPVIKSYSQTLTQRWQLFLPGNTSRNNEYQSNLFLTTQGVGSFLNPGSGMFFFNMATGALLNSTAPGFPGNETAANSTAAGNFMNYFYQPYYLHTPTNSILMADDNSNFALYDIASNTFIWKWTPILDGFAAAQGFESGIAVSSDGKIFLQDYNGNVFTYGCPVGMGLANDGSCVSCTLVAHTQSCVPPPSAPVAAPSSPSAPGGSPSSPGGTPSSPKAPGGTPSSPKAPGSPSSAESRVVHGLLLIAALMTSLFVMC